MDMVRAMHGGHRPAVGFSPDSFENRQVFGSGQGAPSPLGDALPGLTRRQILGGLLALPALLLPSSAKAAEVAPMPRRYGGELVGVMKPRPPAKYIAWEPNIRVLAACGQDYYAKICPEEFRSIYTYELTKLMKAQPHLGFEDAHAVLESVGYMVPAPPPKPPARSHVNPGRLWPFNTHWFDGTFNPPPAPPPKPVHEDLLRVHPPSTMRRLTSWQRDEQKPRYALLLGHQTGQSMFDKSIRHDLDTVTDTLTQAYGLKPGVIHRAEAATAEDVLQGLAWLGQMMQQHPGAEALVYYTGHGDANEVPPTEAEGSAKGVLVGPDVDEEQLKAWTKILMRRYLDDGKNPAKLLMVMDMCHAGATTARRDTPSRKFADDHAHQLSA